MCKIIKEIKKYGQDIYFGVAVRTNYFQINVFKPTIFTVHSVFRVPALNFDYRVKFSVKTVQNYIIHNTKKVLQILIQIHIPETLKQQLRKCLVALISRISTTLSWILLNIFFQINALLA